ncbi:unnamed protein product, partial [Closterium sp. NIES-54]
VFIHVPTCFLVKSFLFLHNLVSNAAIHDVWVDTFVPGGQRVAISTCSRIGRHLATFTQRPRSSMYTLTTAFAQVAAAGQVAASSQVTASCQLAASCSCRVLSHQTLLWHHRLGHPSLPQFRGMHSRLLVSGLPRSLPSLSRSLDPPCLACVEGRQHVAPHSSEFPTTTAPLQTLHMVADVSGVLIPWIRATRRQLCERFSQDFPVLRLHSERGCEFSSDLLAEFCRDEGIIQMFTLPASPRQNGIAERRIGLIMEVARTSMVHAAAPHFLWPFAVRYAAHQLNLWSRVFEPETSPTLRWMGKVGDASVFWVWGALSLVRDATANKLSSCTLRCDPAPSGVSQVDLPPLVEPLEVSSDSSGPVEGGDPAVDNTAATRRSPRLETPPGFPPRPSSPPPQPAAVDSRAESAGAEFGGAEPKGEGSGGAVSGGATTGGDGSWVVATGGVDSGGPASPSGGGAVGDPAGGPGAGQPLQLDLLETLSLQVICAWIFRQGRPGGGGYGPAGGGAASPGGTAGARGTGGTAGARGAASAGGTRGATGAGGAGATSPRGSTGAAGAGPTSPEGTASGGGAGGTASARGTGAGGTGGAGAAGPGGARRGGAGASGAGGVVRAGGPTGAAGSGCTGGAAGAGAAGAGAAGAGGTAGAGGAGGAIGAAGTGGVGGTTGARGPRAAKASGAAGAGGAGGAAGAAGAGGAGAAGAGGAGAAGTALCRPFFYSQPQSSLPPPDSVLRQVLSLPSSTSLPLPLLCPPTDQSPPQLPPGSPLPALGPHTEVTKSLTERREPETRASTPVRARRVARPRPPAVPGTHGMARRPSSSDLARAASPTVTRLLATVVTDPDLESTAAFALVTELVDFAARSRLDYVASLVTESESIELEYLAAGLPRFASMLLCPEGDPDALDIPTPCSYAEAIAGEYSSQWQTAMDAEMGSRKSTGTYVDEVPPPWANKVDGMWIFKVKRPPGSPPAFKARYVARGFTQRDYDLHSLDFSTTFLQGILHEEIWLCRPHGFTGSFPAGTQWSLWWPVYGLCQAPREWHDTLRTTLAALGFAPSSADPSVFLHTDATLPPFYVLVYVNDLVFATADTEALALVKAELQERHTCTDQGDLRSYLGLQITRDRAWCTITLTQSHMVHQVLQHFAFQFSSPQPTPLSTGHSLSALPSDESVEPIRPYPELVGCLMYLMTCTRPDLAYPLSLLACYVAPGRHRNVHWDAAKRVLRYLCSTLGMGLVL